MYTYEQIEAQAQTLIDILTAETDRCWNSDTFTTVFELTKGRKYNRMVKDTKNKKTGEMHNQRSVACFIDNEGNIYKPAGWKAPAKGIRGNIFENSGMATDGRGFIRYL